MSNCILFYHQDCIFSTPSNSNNIKHKICIILYKWLIANNLNGREFQQGMRNCLYTTLHVNGYLCDSYNCVANNSIGSHC